MYIAYNPNPRGINTGDCVIRALCKAFDLEWDKVYVDLTVRGLQDAMWGDTNAVWEKYIKEHGFVKQVIPNSCPDCYTVEDFTREHPTGTYIVATGSHVVTVKDGKYYDSWDSGYLIPSYYFELKEKQQ